MNFSGFAQGALQLGLEQMIMKPKRGIYSQAANQALLLPQITISEKHHDDMDITEHPVEQGAPITDHAFKRPVELIVEAAWSNSPSNSGSLLNAAIGYASANIPSVGKAVNLYQQVQGVLGAISTINSSQGGGSQTALNAIYAQLVLYQQAAILLQIYTLRKTYSNMLLKTITLETTERSEDSMFAVLSFKEVILVNTVVTTITNPANPAVNDPGQDQGGHTLKPATPAAVPGVTK
jgi:hypothetical protein